MRNIFFKRLAPAAVLSAFIVAGGMSIQGCTGEIAIDIDYDKAAFDGMTETVGMLSDLGTSSSEASLDMWQDRMETSVCFSLNRESGRAIDVKVEYDGEYLETWNKVHGTSYELYPEANVTIADGGNILLAPDDRNSVPLSVSVSAFEGMTSSSAYLIPLKITSVTDGIGIKEGGDRVTYIVRDTRNTLSTYKGDDAVKTVVFFELGDANPLNALQFRLSESGALFFDYVVLFSGNINYSPSENRVYFHRNDDVQFILDHADEYIRPLQHAGIKVLMGVLGNHDDSGLSQLSRRAAESFAGELAAFCDTYQLDGVCFDDEYSNTSPDLSNPLFTTPSRDAAARLLYETKKAMPEKTLMVYYLGYINSYLPSVDGVEPGFFVDFAVDDYRAGAAEPMSGMTLAQCSGSSIELSKQQGSNEAGDDSEATAALRKSEGYGYYMFFSLNPEWYATRSQVNRCRNVAAGLYGQNIAQITHYYEKESTELTALERPQ